MREIVVDVETTGLDTDRDRIVEVGCVLLRNHLPADTWQSYVNPGVPVPEEAIEVHGLTNPFLASHPRFKEIAPHLRDILDNGRLIAHNASFDYKMLMSEFQRAGVPAPRVEVVDTLELGRRRFPTGPLTLTSLCQRLGVSVKGRIYHGALLDASLLADCYVDLIGGRQSKFDLTIQARRSGKLDLQTVNGYLSAGDRDFRATDEEVAAWRAAVLDRVKAPVWAVFDEAIRWKGTGNG